MIRTIAIWTVLIASLLTSNSCKDDPTKTSDCFVPEIVVNKQINMTLPQYFNLQNIGEYILIDGGNRGIFVVHNYDDQFYALERTCTYKSDLACSVIHVDSTNLQLRCGTYSDTGYVECCASKFQFSGLVTEGPSICNLKNYRVAIQNNTLFITN